MSTDSVNRNTSTNVKAGAKQRHLSITLIEQAAHWHTLMRSGAVTKSEQAAFNTWHAVSENAQAYQRMAVMWQQIDDVDLAPAKETLQAVLTGHKQQRTKHVFNTFGMAGLLVFGLVISAPYINQDNRLVNYISPGYLFADHNTDIGENIVITLSDNTRIHLNTFSAINVEFTKKSRVIHLLQGEIQLDVAKDANRALIVKTAQGTARALGTQFIVEERGDITDVTVTESRVEVCATNNKRKINHKTTFQKDHCQQLQAGQRTHIKNNLVLLPQPINTQFIHDWSQQLLIVENQPVLKVLEQLRRYHYGYLQIDRAALANYTVSGVFPLNDLTKSLQVLSGSLPIKVTTYTPLFTIIKAKRR